MKQEVQVTITLEVDTSKSKEDVKAFLIDMEQTHTHYVSRETSIVITKFEVTSIKEESEIYGTEEEVVSQQPQEEPTPTNTHPETVAYEEGRTAWAQFEANNGKRAKGNPYEFGTVENAAWNRGFNVG